MELDLVQENHHLESLVEKLVWSPNVVMLNLTPLQECYDRRREYQLTDSAK